jgi:hypothetical protein
MERDDALDGSLDTLIPASDKRTKKWSTKATRRLSTELLVIFSAIELVDRVQYYGEQG